MNLSERTVNALYIAAIVSSVPGFIVYLKNSILMGPLLTVASAICVMTAVLGFLNRRRKLDVLASIVMIAYAAILGLLSATGWLLIALE